MLARHESEETLRTIDHDEIRDWVEARDGRPSVVSSTHGDEEGGILRIDFGTKEESLEEVSWKEFFKIFEDSELAFVYQEHAADGEPSYLCKFVTRDDADEASRADSDQLNSEEEEEEEDDFNNGDEDE